MECPVCGVETTATGKEWKFGQFEAVGYKCPMGHSSSAYYRDGKFSHTVPKSKK